MSRGEIKGQDVNVPGGLGLFREENRCRTPGGAVGLLPLRAVYGTTPVNNGLYLQ